MLLHLANNQPTQNEVYIMIFSYLLIGLLALFLFVNSIIFLLDKLCHCMNYRLTKSSCYLLALSLIGLLGFFVGQAILSTVI